MDLEASITVFQSLCSVSKATDHIFSPDASNTVTWTADTDLPAFAFMGIQWVFFPQGSMERERWRETHSLSKTVLASVAL